MPEDEEPIRIDTDAPQRVRQHLDISADDADSRLPRLQLLDEQIVFLPFPEEKRPVEIVEYLFPGFQIPYGASTQPRRVAVILPLFDS